MWPTWAAVLTRHARRQLGLIQATGEFLEGARYARAHTREREFPRGALHAGLHRGGPISPTSIQNSRLGCAGWLRRDRNLKPKKAEETQAAEALRPGARVLEGEEATPRSGETRLSRVHHGESPLTAVRECDTAGPLGVKLRPADSLHANARTRPHIKGRSSSSPAHQSTRDRS